MALHRSSQTPDQLIPYDKEAISSVVRQVLQTAPDRGRIVIELVRMHTRLGRGVCWTDAPVLTLGPDGSRTSRFTLTRGLGADPLFIEVHVPAEEVGKAS